MHCNRITIFITILIVFFLEVTLFDKLRIHGVRPELGLIITVFFGFYFGIVRGAEVGFFSGVLKALFSGANFGINIFLFLLIGFLSGSFKNKLSKENFIIQFFLGSVSVFLLGAGFFTTPNLMMKPDLISAILYKALYTGFLTPPIFFVLGKIYESKDI